MYRKRQAHLNKKLSPGHNKQSKKAGKIRKKREHKRAHRKKGHETLPINSRNKNKNHHKSYREMNGKKTKLLSVPQ